MTKLLIVLIFFGVLFTSYNFINTYHKINSNNIPVLNNSEKYRVENQLNIVKKLVDTNSKFNNEIAFFIDMKIHSGKNRFFIYDLKNNKLIDEGLVAHGSGSETQVAGILKFSNTNNSFCTSLGK